MSHRIFQAVYTLALERLGGDKTMCFVNTGLALGTLFIQSVMAVRTVSRVL